MMQAHRTDGLGTTDHGATVLLRKPGENQGTFLVNDAHRADGGVITDQTGIEPDGEKRCMPSGVVTIISEHG